MFCQHFQIERKKIFFSFRSFFHNFFLLVYFMCGLYLLYKQLVRICYRIHILLWHFNAGQCVRIFKFQSISRLKQQILCKQNKIIRKEESEREYTNYSAFFQQFFGVCSGHDPNFYRLGNKLHANDAKTFDFHATAFRNNCAILSIELKSFPFIHSPTSSRAKDWLIELTELSSQMWAASFRFLHMCFSCCCLNLHANFKKPWCVCRVHRTDVS